MLFGISRGDPTGQLQEQIRVYPLLPRVDLQELTSQAHFRPFQDGHKPHPEQQMPLQHRSLVLDYEKDIFHIFGQTDKAFKFNTQGDIAEKWLHRSSVMRFSSKAKRQTTSLQVKAASEDEKELQKLKKEELQSRMTHYESVSTLVNKSTSCLNLACVPTRGLTE